MTNETILIHVETKRNNPMSSDETHTRLFKVEQLPARTGRGPDADEPDTDNGHEEAEYALWEYNGTGYGYLETLHGVSEKAVPLADHGEERVEDYILDAEIIDIDVTQRST